MTEELGADLIRAERLRQIEIKGCTAHLDDTYTRQELAIAAVHYARNLNPTFTTDYDFHGETSADLEQLQPARTLGDFAWPWGDESDKRGRFTRIRELQVAGALIAAEMDRLIRAGGSMEGVVFSQSLEGAADD